MKLVLSFLLGLFSLAPFGSFGQSLRPDLRRILIEFASSVDQDQAQDLLGKYEGFLPVREGALLKGNRWLMAWFDPGSPQIPASAEELTTLVEHLRDEPAVTFAEVFLVDANGASVGLTPEIYLRTTEASVLDEVVNVTQGTLRESAYLRGWHILRLPVHHPLSNIEWAARLQGLAGVLQAEPNLLYQIAATSNDPRFSAQWALKNTGTASQGYGTPGADMAVEEAWSLTTGNPGVRIAIIDSGVDTAHADLRDNLLPGFDATGGGSEGFPNLNYDSDGHGTACAGIVGAKGNNFVGIAGVCYDCGIVPVKLFTYLFNPFGAPLPFATGGDMADAIGWAWQVADVRVMSNSWGLTDLLLNGLPDGTGIVEAALSAAIDSANGGAGVSLVFSSGNEGDDPIWPSRLPGIISVNATSMCDERKSPTSCDGLDWEGNWGDSLDVGAPGVLIASTDMSGSFGYDPTDLVADFGGTSAACPNVAGVMGLIYAMDSSLTATAADHILMSTCDRVGGYVYSTNALYPHGEWSPELGYGRVNAHSAVQATQPVAADGEQASSISVSIAPNPVKDDFTIVLQNVRPGTVQFQLWDVQGRSIWESGLQLQHGSIQRHHIQLDRSRIGGGIYLLQILHPNGVATKRLNIQD